MLIEPITPISGSDTIDIKAHADADRAAEKVQAVKEAAKIARDAKIAKEDAVALIQAQQEVDKTAHAAKLARAETTAVRKSEDEKEVIKAPEYAKSDAAKYQANKAALEHTLAAKTDKVVVLRRAASAAAALAANVANEVISKDEEHQAVDAYQANNAQHIGSSGGYDQYQ